MVRASSIPNLMAKKILDPGAGHVVARQEYDYIVVTVYMLFKRRSTVIAPVPHSIHQPEQSASLTVAARLFEHPSVSRRES